MDLPIELRDVWFGYQGGRLVLRGLNLTVQSGELTAVLGSSGAGKSTLLKLTAGLLSPGRGSVIVWGKDVLVTPPQERSIGFVFQHLALFPNLSVRENALFGLKYARVKSPGQMARLEELLKTLELLPVANKLPAELSGGQAQRVALVRALASAPRLLLLDEPFSSLDRPMAEAARELFTRIHRDQGLTSVLVTHDWGQALTVADRVIVLGIDGQIVQASSPKEAYDNPRSAEAAALTGPVNVLRGIVSSSENNSLTVVSCGGIIQARWTSNHPTPPEGSAVHLVFRPEWVSLVEGSDNRPGVLRARVTQVVQVGQRVVVHVSVDGTDLIAECGNGSGPPVGSSVSLILNENKALAFPTAGRK